jgi:hypothetical protein
MNTLDDTPLVVEKSSAFRLFACEEKVNNRQRIKKKRSLFLSEKKKEIAFRV